MRTLNSFELPPYKGATFRGAFGYAIKRIACVKKEGTCEDCMLKSRCIYSYIFETPPPEGTERMTKYTAAPHPFIIEPPLEEKTFYERGEELDFSLILAGKAIDYLPYFVYAFTEIGKKGIGRDRGKYEIEKVINYDTDRNSSAVIYETDKKLYSPSYIIDEEKIKEIALKKENTEEITFKFITPTRIKYRERFTDSLEFHVFVRNILRRLSLLSYFHCNTSMELDFKSVIEKSKEVSIENSKLYWQDWERYSGRQKQRMKMGGFVGEVKFRGDLTDYLPWILAGEYLHLGKGASFGLGKYEVFF